MVYPKSDRVTISH